MKKRMLDLILSAFAAGGLAVLLDFLSVLSGRALSVFKFAALFGGLFLIIWLLPAVSSRGRKWVAGVLASMMVLILASFLCWRGVSEAVVYDTPDQGKALLYGGKKVMLLVPHQDDDINVLGGVIEEYVKYGSQVYIVFSTNGDSQGLTDIRYQEALTAAEMMGVPENQVIFLGYGDQWAPDGPHLYNAGSGEVVSSYFGRTETYGTDAHGAYRAGRAYTVDNFLDDLEAVILEHRADVLYCVDHDYNMDHRALSMAFEKVMGRILQKDETYRPQVYKGYAYSTAWEGKKDFYAENLLSTQNVLEPPSMKEMSIYRWEERLRLPVHGEGLSRSLISAGAQEILSSYASQGANMHGIRVLNSDKVFWQRRTDSLCYCAAVEDRSGAVAVLKDFMVLEDRDLKEAGADLQDGAWIPEHKEDGVQVIFPEPQDVKTVVLYDLPDKAANVLNARLVFDDGTVLETGPLDPGGAASRFAVEKKGVASFAVTLTQWEGTAGLTEIEAFGADPVQMPFVKLMDEEGIFAYDYWIDSRGEQLFSLYASGAEHASWCLNSSNEGCSAVWEGDKIRIVCPAGEETVITVSSEDGSISDSVLIRNPGWLKRNYTMFWLRAEEMVMKLCDEKRLHERLFLCRIWQKVPGAAARIFS